MKTYQITVNGQQYDVGIEDLDASPVVVRVNGKPFEVIVADTSAARPPRASQSDEPEIEMDAYVPAAAATYLEIAVDEEDSPAAAPAAAPPAATAQSAAEEALTVSAPMPGTILDIAVQAGDQVSSGDILCNLEAMKMKSPIRAPGDGKIAQVLINEGQNVSYGEVLFTLT